uniref:PH domain-containing protein n=1 Tax=Meleagris gallopavo TaxID=9103 RepID=A0A803XUM9_MELGA
EALFQLRGGSLSDQLPSNIYNFIMMKYGKLPRELELASVCVFSEIKHFDTGFLLLLPGFYCSDKEPRGIIPLENLSIREVEDPRKPNCFELYNPSHKGQVIKACKTEADGRVVEGNHVVYRISAPTPEEKEEWIKSIKASISRDPFYDMLATRKRRIANKK